MNMQTLEEDNLKKPTFIDLFAGIGGFRIGMEAEGFRCVFSCEKNAFCKKIYNENFNEKPFGDIKTLDPNSVPDHDVLVGGFPCQAFSMCGKKKGFDDKRGDLIFYIINIIKVKKPKVIILENAKNIISHDNGKTIEIIRDLFEKEGYYFNYEILNAMNFGVPQSRERTIIVASLYGKFDFKTLETKEPPILKDFLDKNVSFDEIEKDKYELIPKEKLKTKKKTKLIFAGYIKNKQSELISDEKKLFNSTSHSQPYRIYSTEGVSPTLISTESGGRYYILDENIVRKMTVNECYKIMGFPETYKRIGKQSKQYSVIGNSIAIPMVKELANKIKKHICQN